PWSTNSRMVIAAVCQPLATCPRKIDPPAASGAVWEGCGSYSRAKAMIASAVTSTSGDSKLSPTATSSKYTGARASGLVAAMALLGRGGDGGQAPVAPDRLRGSPLIRPGRRG